MKVPSPLTCLALFSVCASAADQPQWGVAWSRNLVSAERGLPDSFDPESGRNVKWSAPLGGETHSTPIVAGGRVFIGTNNDQPRDPKITGDRGVLLCLDEKDGHLLWQLAAPKRTDDQYFDWPKAGISSSATVERDRVYIVGNRGDVLCLDVQGQANGNEGPFKDEAAYLTPHAAPPPGFTPVLASAGDIEPGEQDADIVWMFDLPSGAGIWPHDAAHSSILIHGEFLYLNSGTGVDNTHRAIRNLTAPSLVVLEKSTGRFVARDGEKIASRIFHSTWSAPSLMKLDGQEMIVFAGGDGIVRGFAPLASSPPTGEVATLEMLWSYDIDPGAPKEDVHRFTSNKQQGPSNIYGMPVVVGSRVFVAGGGDVFWGKNAAWLKCAEIRRTADGFAASEAWSYPLDKHVLSTPAVHEGLAFIADTGRNVHCVDADSGERNWTHQTKGDFWSSPLVADGKVFLGTRKGDFWVFAAAREKKVLSSIELGSPISGTATAANGVLYIARQARLLAVALDQPAR